VLHDSRDPDRRLALLHNMRAEIKHIKKETHDRRRGPTTGFRAVDMIQAPAIDSESDQPILRNPLKE
jgi:hypothetical protein